MQLLVDVVVAIVLAIAVGPDAAALDTTPPRSYDDCRPTLSVGHVPGHMDKVWTIRCN